MIFDLGNEFFLSTVFILAVASSIFTLFARKKTWFTICSIALFCLFFAICILINTADILSIILFIIGLVLICIEVLIPGFGIIGIVGGFVLFYGLINAFKDFKLALITISASIIIAILLIVLLVRLGLDASLFNKSVLKNTLSKSEGYNSKKDYSYLVGKNAITAGVLRPSGVIKLEDDFYDCISESIYIDINRPVKIVAFKDGNIIVREIKE